MNNIVHTDVVPKYSYWPKGAEGLRGAPNGSLCLIDKGPMPRAQSKNQMTSKGTSDLKTKGRCLKNKVRCLKTKLR